MDTSPAGLAALALIVLLLGFWVPQQVHRRQLLADARTGDRFSGGLRVLTVADGAGKGRPMRPTRTTGGTGGSVPLVGPPPARSSSATPGPGRFAVLERRAARARRRLVMTLALVLLTAGAWTAVGLGYLVWQAAVVPSALLLVVLVLGRLAVLSARRSDARWRAERRAQQQRATQRRTLAHGGPYAPRNRARVTGRAVHPSDTSTQMIPRVQTDGTPSARARAASSPAGNDAGAERADDADPERGAAGSGRVTDSGHERVDSGPTAGVGPVLGASGGTPWRVGGEPWEPVPVPLPTYVTKAQAPRREQETTVPVHAPRPTTAAPSGSDAPSVGPDHGTHEDSAAPPSGDSAQPAGDEPRPRTETLGLPLEQILARRRAAG
ncbi:hypothetical protein [Isoptericola chiayiensis]|uniref:hypothetical protein n=1 Tax=Isoptericola chiayiensis TaxID=579446 RepID=UPI00155689F9|nr:hypothetical protein [Isoptericola chiayiensis]NOV99482.1 heme exporter protein D [Isoptericola chiayiensis]